jgi:hypothetical protein
MPDGSTATRALRRSALPRLGVPRAGLLVVAALAFGCAPRARVELRQPTAPPAQRCLNLASASSCYSTESGPRRCLLGFPLPGSADGPHDFLLFLTTPDRDGWMPIDSQDPNAARGFLLQVVGELAGKSCLASGTVRYQRVPLQSKFRKLTIDARCADGTVIRGNAYVRADVHAVRDFAWRYAADVGALDVALAASAPEDSPDDAVPEGAGARSIEAGHDAGRSSDDPGGTGSESRPRGRSVESGRRPLHR